MLPSTHPAIRASSQERDATVQELQTAFADGRITELEFDERMTLALNARTQAELSQLVADLPNSSGLSSPSISTSALSQKNGNALAILSGFERKGHWVVPAHLNVVAMMGGCVLDLRQAELTSSQTVFNIMAFMGGVEIIVPPGIRVEMQGVPVMGGWSNRTRSENLPTNAPVVLIRGVAVMGGVDVKSK
jgi:hypothetical protein